MNFILKHSKIVVIDRHASRTVGEMWRNLNMYLNWTLLWIDICKFAVSICIMGVIVRRLKNRIAMQLMDGWKLNKVMLDRKTIIL